MSINPARPLTYSQRERLRLAINDLEDAAYNRGASAAMQAGTAEHAILADANDTARRALLNILYDLTDLHRP